MTRAILFARIKHELLRLRGEVVLLLIVIGVFFAVGISRGNAENIVYKMGLLAVASIAIHISRQLMFPYICLEDCIKGDCDFKDIPVPIRCAVIIGILFLYPVLVYAVMVAG